MSLWKIAWRSMQQRALASALTTFSVGLGVALVVTVLVIHSVIDQSFRRGAQGYDVIVGARGSPLQLVLNSVFYLSQPIENIPYSFYEEFITGRFVSAVETAIPICMGHAYEGFPAVATVPEMFEELSYLDGREYEFAEGHNFRAENYFEAVIGATAARETGLKLGHTFRPVATIAEGEQSGEEGHDAFTVVGILAPTGTPNDRALFMNMEGFFRCPAHMQAPSSSKQYLQGSGGEPSSHGDADQDAHDETLRHEHHGEDHDHVHREVTAILVCTDLSKPQLAMSLPEVINEGQVAQAVMPARVISDLLDKIVGNVQLLLLLLAVLVVVVAGIGILVSIYNSMIDRRHEIAIMRALGASRLTVMAVILLESILLSLGGGVLGLVLGHGLIGLLAPTIADQFGVIVGAFQFQAVELVLIPGLIVLATLVGYLPALSAYRTDVAKSLTSAA